MARAKSRALIAAVGIACMPLACQPVAREPAPAIPPPAAVTVAAVFAGPIAASFEVTGALQPLEQVEIAPGLDGRVAKAFVQEGERVRPGQSLFLLYRATTPGGRRAAKTIRVKSPIAGVVLARHAKPGDQVSAAPPTAMALVADIDLLQLTAPLPEERFTQVRAGQEVTVTTDVLPGRGFAGRVSRTFPADGTAAAAGAVEIIVDNRDLALRPGMSARGRVFTAQRPRTILVPAAALTDGRVTLVEDGAARVRPVRTGIRNEEAVEVLDGVEPGDLVVVSGGAGISDGDPVAYREPLGPAPPAR